MYKRPILHEATVSAIIEKSNVSAHRLLADLEKLDIIKVPSEATRNKVYIFQKYVALFTNISD